MSDRRQRKAEKTVSRRATEALLHAEDAATPAEQLAQESGGGFDEVKQAAVLSGGGADGAYGVGVIKALAAGQIPRGVSERPFDPEIFTGTSIGSFNASFLTAQWDHFGTASAGNLERVWLKLLAEGPHGNGAFRFKGDPLSLFKPQRYFPNPATPLLQFAQDSASLGWEAVQRAVDFATAVDEPIVQRGVELLNFSSFISREPWARTIREAINFGAIRNSTRRLRIVATNWATGQLRTFSNAEMSDTLGPLAIEASSALPGFFPPAYVGSQPFVDGAVLLNTPLKPAIGAEARELYVVYLDPEIRSIPLSEQENTLETLYRMQQIAWANAVKGDIASARRINETLALLDRSRLQGRDHAPVIEVLRKRFARFKPLTIHRFFPREDFGGALGLLDLNRDRIANLIERGFDDARSHNCIESGCVVPMTGLSVPALEAALEAGDSGDP